MFATVCSGSQIEYSFFFIISPPATRFSTGGSRGRVVSKIMGWDSAQRDYLPEMSAPVLIAGQNAHFEAPRLQRSAYAMEKISPRVVHVEENQSQQ